MSTITDTEPLIPLQALAEASECLRTLAHPCRLRMVEMLLVQERTVGELADACGIPSHMASEHLRILRDRGLLVADRRGRRVYYAVRESGLASILACVRSRFGPAPESSEGDSR
ncbi:MAG: transcriptional regulator [Planctomycetes bacterium]|nr:transcriptional regulator [Planctomycetota bacterium]